jgi:sugar lactone lactonase YvrE
MGVVLDGRSFLEGPRWHEGALWLSDMHAHQVLRVTSDVEIVLRHDSPVSGLGWLPDGRLLVVAMDGEVLRIDARGPTVHADLTHLAPHGVNDMISHPGGWSYVGQFGYDRHVAGNRPVPSGLLRVGADGSVDVVADDLLVANGMGLTADGRTLVVAESAGNRLRGFTVADDGTLTDSRVWAELPPGHAPDGMCLDAEGAAWFAAVLAGAFVRVAEGGEVLDRIPVDEGRHAIACVLGGPERRTLFQLTSTTKGDAEPSLAAMDARVDATEVAVPGEGRP